jgi:CheY-like chemotaxis protein
MDYLKSVRQRLSFLPQGAGSAPSNLARDHMIVLAQRILQHMPTQLAAKSSDDPSRSLDHRSAQDESMQGQFGPAASFAPESSSQLSPSHTAACSTINTLLHYLQDASSCRSQMCNLSEICQAAINQCQPLLKTRPVDMKFLGRKCSKPLRVLLVDDSAFVRRRLERLMINRGYHYESCSDGESAVKAFEATLLFAPSACCRFDLIIMDKEMPTPEQDGFRTAGVSAVQRIRELSQLHTEYEPKFTCPCIIGNSSCGDEADPTLILFCNELRRARLQSGLSCERLIFKEKLSTWSDAFDAQVRQLCGMNDNRAAELDELPIVWGKPVRLEMLFRNLITNAISHGKPAEGEHRVHVSYDIVDARARLHPCLMQSDLDDDAVRSVSWHVSESCDGRQQRFVQVTVSDNGPGIYAKSERTKKASSDLPDSSAVAEKRAGGVSNFGVCLRSIVCPEIASCHGAMGVHSRTEPTSGCSFVVALPYKKCAPGHDV